MSAAIAAEPFRVLSFGGGVQTIALVYAWIFDGIIMPRDVPGWQDYEGPIRDRLDLCIFADTQCEPPEVMRAVDDIRDLCEDAGIRFETVTVGDLSAPPLSSTGVQGIYIPAYTRKLFTDEEGPAGKEGQLLRQCTHRYKIEPVQARARELAGDRPIEMVLGISVEEAHRMKRRNVDDQIQNRYPLIYDLWLGMTRNDCINYLRDLEVPAAKSACVMCPFKRNAHWVWMYRNQPELFARAVAYDRWVRDKRPGFECFIHDSRRPLEDVVPEIVAASDQQPSLFPIDLDMSAAGGCDEGYCGN